MSFAHADIYRGIATLIIILQHVSGLYGTRLFTPLGGIGVAIFLISSGYGLNESYKKLGDINLLKYTQKYWKSKLFRVFLPYAFFITIITILSGEFNLKTYLLDILCINPSYWYLGILLFSYLIFFIISISSKIYRYKYIIIFLSSVFIFFVGSSIWAEQAISFLIGIYISDNREKVKSLFSKLAIQISLFAVGAILLCLKQISVIRVLDGTFMWSLIQLMMKVSFAIFIIIISWAFFKYLKFNFFVFIGKMSLEMYLVHLKCLYFLNIEIVFEPVLQIIIFFTITIIVSWLFNYLVNKFNASRFKL